MNIIAKLLDNDIHYYVITRISSSRAMGKRNPARWPGLLQGMSRAAWERACLAIAGKIIAGQARSHAPLLPC
ncbi:hypothetical protein N5C60_09740 [Pseudomonas mosselii]|uniref:Uncharacterized protein n=1 Tax=Pseudomonas mosselii TaxID=78327 RepID=A0A7W2PXV7_9PSED|nr:hypothetical protein [Pseudomonas mosselii]MBA6064881.1 hypothetical protein [Pseudomonas mosselii]MBC7211922.1 hypothetical protein [Pseudomonas sp.]MDH1144898.1 hypothetical protein [Pseudomonas mosselii]